MSANVLGLASRISQMIEDAKTSKQGKDTLYEKLLGIHTWSLTDLGQRVVKDDYQNKKFRVLIGWSKRFKISIGKNKCTSKATEATNMKPRRKGVYTFLYGGRVDVNTFYNYKDQL
ncbi:hypothetical protein C0995_009923 [Termitomyces sp. Mi166|nr:hypothetical protein C0995_009923 [Termitomyces sp. Mi166\